MKRGSILLHGAKEQVLMLFTNGIVLANAAFDNFVNTLYDVNSDESAEDLTHEQLRKRFESLDFDGSGCKYFTKYYFCIHHTWFMQK